MIFTKNFNPAIICFYNFLLEFLKYDFVVYFSLWFVVCLFYMNKNDITFWAEDEVSKLTINAEGQTLPVWGLATDDFELVVPATEEEDGDVVDHPMGGEEMKDEDELKEIG